MHGRGLFIIHRVCFRQIGHVSSSEVFPMKLYTCFKNIGIERYLHWELWVAVVYTVRRLGLCVSYIPALKMKML